MFINALDIISHLKKNEAVMYTYKLTQINVFLSCRILLLLIDVWKISISFSVTAAPE